VTWFDGAVEPRPRQVLAAWLAARIEEGVRVAVIGDRGHLKTQPLAMITGLRAAPQPRGSLRISHRSKEIGLELEPIPSPPPNPLVIDAPDFTPWLSLTDTAGRRYDEVFIAPWGGVMPGRYGVMEMPGGLDQFRWVTDPFAFLTAALALPSLPVPDTTTENGRRLLFAHVDGDAFPSRAEMPGKLLAAEVLQRDILERYRIPHAMSVIEAEVAPHGLYPRESAEMEGVARRMFALPHVEIASHSYTHPFYWEDTAAGKVSVAAQGYTLAPQDYVPSLEREILGSAGYIRQRLAPREKPVSLMLWTGNAAPTGRALEVAEQGGMLNLNGGNTIITRAYPSLTAISPLGVRHPQGFHVYAPIMNENVFTNLWTGPYYGFERVIETFQMTGSPRRIKPIDIYYHTYSASKPASLRALHKVYGWAMAQPVHPVFPSEFVRKAMNFNSVVLARPVGGNALLVRNAVHLRTLRAPAGLGVPDMAASRGLAGWRAGEEGRYLHLADSRAEIRFAPAANRLPMLHSANARLSRWKAVDKGLQFRLQGHQALELELVHPPQCLLSSAGKTLPGSSRDKQHFLYRTSHAAADFDLRCP
ncbi:hypothetical protein, partial [Zoogloea sp.]|uniref:polysaccharide deacetylase family protein n=1 Tax=Zoogloea sp. TaxID=49181 RepID=UPI00260495EE